MVVVTGPAQADLQEAHDWWADHRSRQQATRWYRAAIAAIRRLRKEAPRFAKAPEWDLLPGGVRQLTFGLSSRPTHRILFTIDGDTVVVLRVRHGAQDALGRDDLTP